MRESEIISMIHKIFNYKGKDIVVGVGDDCAVLNVGRRYLVVTCDDMVDGTHFISDFLKPCEIASRLVRINVSDIYAMGDSKPLYSLVSAGLRKGISKEWVEGFMYGLKRELDRFKIKNIGGNLTRSPVMFFNMTLIGSISSSGILRRKGAKVGDYLCVAGSTGFSYVAVEIMKSKKRASLSRIEESIISRFCKPPLFERSRRIISKFSTSMIDNSDGIYKTSEIISNENSVKVVIDADLLYKTTDRFVKRYLSEKKEMIYASLVSDDYNPVFTIPPHRYDHLLRSLPFVKKIGYIGDGFGVEVLNYDKRIESFEHF